MDDRTLAVYEARADLETLPFAGGSIAAAFARHSYLHLHRDRLVAALCELRRVLRPGGRALVTLIAGNYDGHALPEDDFPGRYFALWSEPELVAGFAEAGFAEVLVETVERRRGEALDLLVSAGA